MITIFGTRTYGIVDRVPGIGYVASHFFHINFVPLIPVKSFFVLEGTESGDEFRGTELPMSGRSVLAGYLRGWGLIAAAVAGAIGCGFAVQRAGMPGPAAFAAGAAAVVLALLAVFVTNQIWLIAQGLFHVGTLSAVATMMFTNTVGNFETSAVGIANVALLLAGLTRLMDKAGWARAVDLLERLGYDHHAATELVDAVLAGRPLPEHTEADDDLSDADDDPRRRRTRTEDDEDGRDYRRKRWE